MGGSGSFQKEESKYACDVQVCFGVHVKIQQTCTSVGTTVPLDGAEDGDGYRAANNSCISPTLHQAQGFFGLKLMVQRVFLNLFPEML